jgi:restriction endonuclease S subunit
MVLDQWATVSQGVTPSRVQTMPGSDTIRFSFYTMKEMNESLGMEYHGNTEKLQEIHVSSDKANGLPVSKENMVLINLTGHRAVAIRPEHTGKLITSNFAIIEPNKELHSLYLEWYVNEHPACRKQLRVATQGTVVAALSIQMLRSLEIEIPSIMVQEMISNIYALFHRKKHLINERLHLEEQLIKQVLLGFNKEEIK